MHNDGSSRLSPLTQTGGVHVAIADDPRIVFGPSQLPSVQTNGIAVRRGPPGIRHSKTNSGFAHQISHKLSSTFGNPTIVHRPNLRARPALLSMHEEPPIAADNPYDHLPSPQKSTAPSSYNASGSVSTGDPSTVGVDRALMSSLAFWFDIMLNVGYP